MDAVDARRDAGKADVEKEGPYRVWFSFLARGVHDWHSAAPRPAEFLRLIEPPSGGSYVGSADNGGGSLSLP
jgi:hypothetical protein